jgi:hypothetical protein
MAHEESFAKFGKIRRQPPEWQGALIPQSSNLLKDPFDHFPKICKSSKVTIAFSGMQRYVSCSMSIHPYPQLALIKSNSYISFVSVSDV